MKALVLYPYPLELDGVSLQGEMLYQGLLRNKVHAKPCDFTAGMEKQWLYKNFKPDFAIGVGFWGNVPDLIIHPQQHGIAAVPWLNADGWISNYHELLNSLPLMFVTSNWVKETYHRDGVTNKNIVPMPVGIDTDEMKPLAPDSEGVQNVRAMLGIKPEQKMILTVGGDTTSKGFQEVLQALAKIDREFPDWVYVGKSWINGSPYYHRRKELEIIKNCGINRHKVKFIEGAFSRQFMGNLLNACDIYAAPSRIEGFGMIQVEAQACGKPVLGIDAMGVKDTIVHNKTGFLAKVGEEVKLTQEWVYRSMGFPKKMLVKFDEPKTFAVRADIDELAEYLLKLLADDSLRERMGKDAREHAVKNFNYVTIAGRIIDTVKKKFNLG